MTKNLIAASLHIKEGPSFQGYSVGARVSVAGEVVFTTSLVGYPESMTDPSYKGQILVFTQPLMGNYGAPDGSIRDEYNLSRYMESQRIHVVGVVIAEYAWKYSHWTAVQSLGEWCEKEGVALVAGIDTRSVVQYLRESGTTVGEIVVSGAPAPSPPLMDDNLVAQVSTRVPVYYPTTHAKDTFNVALIDCGVKENILRCLLSRGANVVLFPYDYDIVAVADQFDGIFISNGPGDPLRCKDTVAANLRKLIYSPAFENLPIFGICMGHQLLALAVGAQSMKMKYGNRAHNIPTLDLTTNQCHITSQNHGYAVDARTLPKDQFVPYFINLNDHSNEGIIHVSRPIYSTQFHPEARGGPQDCSFLFDKYFDNMRTYRSGKKGNCKFTLNVDAMPREKVIS